MQAITAEPVRHSGNAGLFDVLELSLLSQQLNWPFHVHAEGVRGTGKTTIIRSMRNRLPEILRIKGCLYNCDPFAPHCPVHRDLSPEERKAIGTERIRMPYLEIAQSARIGTVVGTIDLERLINAERPEAALLPGTLAKAHRGIVFVDEINRLADTAPELVDVLLDVMGTKPGRIQVEESGLPPVELPVSVTVWAASNPDEDPGPLEEIRRQLSDRFDASVSVNRPGSVHDVRKVLEQNLFGNPLVPIQASTSVAEPSPVRFAKRQLVPAALPAIPGDIQDLLAQAYVRFQLESLRAVEAWQWIARLNAWVVGRSRVERNDLEATLSFVLRHRLEPDTLQQLLRWIRMENPLPAPDGEELPSGLGGPRSPGGARKGMHVSEHRADPPEEDSPGVPSESPAGIRESRPFAGAFSSDDATGARPTAPMPVDRPGAANWLERVRRWVPNPFAGRETWEASAPFGQGEEGGTHHGELLSPYRPARPLSELSFETIRSRLRAGERFARRKK